MTDLVRICLDDKTPETCDPRESEIIRTLVALRPILAGMRSCEITLFVNGNSIGAGVEQRWGAGALTKAREQSPSEINVTRTMLKETA